MSVLVLHSTEGDTAKGAADWMTKQRTMSHQVFDPRTGESITLLPWDTSARSLRNLAGGVETNNRPGVYQLEIVGRAADIPHYSNAWYGNLAEEIDRIAHTLDIPRRFPAAFLPHPASYGPSPVRLTGPQWLEVSGIIGHQHVPENKHGDPGDITRLIAILDNYERPPVTENPYADEVNEALRLLAEHSTYRGTQDGWFGPKAVAALHTLKLRMVEAEEAADQAKIDPQTLMDAALGADAREWLSKGRIMQGTYDGQA